MPDVEDRRLIFTRPLIIHVDLTPISWLKFSHL